MLPGIGFSLISECGHDGQLKWVCPLMQQMMGLKRSVLYESVIPIPETKTVMTNASPGTYANHCHSPGPGKITHIAIVRSTQPAKITTAVIIWRLVMGFDSWPISFHSPVCRYCPHKNHECRYNCSTYCNGFYGIAVLLIYNLLCSGIDLFF